jgi:hypothetical protein
MTSVTESSLSFISDLWQETRVSGFKLYPVFDDTQVVAAAAAISVKFFPIIIKTYMFVI